ncbi:MAG: choice-of-anchor tandem repeat GloVer-containing protein [Rhizomicrobium sp.]
MLLGAFAPVRSAASAHGYSEQIVHSYCEKSKCRDGGGPQAKPLLDPAGNLYVANATVLEFTRDEFGKWNEKTLYTFCSRANCRDGIRPSVSLIMDVSGNLYGTTLLGGKYNTGLAFELLPDAERKRWTEKVLYDFCYPDGNGGCTVGNGTEWQVSGLTYAGAASGALYDGISPLYGTTGHGGTGGSPGGTVFELTPGTPKWQETILYSFCSQTDCADGAYPTAGVILDGNGNLYGTTVDGGHGTGTPGTVFELSSNARRTQWTETVLHSFCSQSNCTDGAGPEGELVMDASGNLLGTTVAGGSTMAGVIFKLVPNGASSTETVLYNFCSRTTNCLDGASPNSSLVLDASGNIFGVTPYGGGNNGGDSFEGSGTLFELTPSQYRVLHKFCAKQFCDDGQFPLAGVILDGAGNLYGTTRSGGKGGVGGEGHYGGTVFQFSPKD